MSYQFTIYRKDVKLFLVLIPLINVLNYYLTYPVISFSAHTIITFVIDTVQGYSAWWVIRYVILKLNQRIEFNSMPLKRILVQLLATSVLSLLVVIALTNLTNLIAGTHPVPRSFYTTDIFIFLIWLFVVNGIYISWHYFDMWQQTHSLHQSEKSSFLRQKIADGAGFMVKVGKRNQIIDYTDIASFFIDEEYVFICTISGDKYIVDNSLDKVEQLLPADIFFRLNRQVIVHKQIVDGYKRLENGKLTVILKPAQNENYTTQISRTKAADFKQWLGADYPANLQFQV